jgi:hypothetical protein
MRKSSNWRNYWDTGGIASPHVYQSSSPANPKSFAAIPLFRLARLSEFIISAHIAPTPATRF